MFSGGFPKKRLWLNFPFNWLLNFKEKKILSLGFNHLEYTGILKQINKSFILVLSKCMKVRKSRVNLKADNFDLLFIRGENGISISFISR